jgi:hypothetical protein
LQGRQLLVCGCVLVTVNCKTAMMLPLLAA